jgi:hypothetical protein
VQGPAKVDLNVFQIKVEGGRIKVRLMNEHAAEEQAISE